MKEIRKLVFRLILSLIALFVLYLLVVFVPAFQTPSSLRTLQASPPPDIHPSAESAAIVRAPLSFNYLVSITYRGFEPASLLIKEGETVRFTNNSGVKAQLSVDGPFADAAIEIAPREFHEVTFDQKGEWHYSDSASREAGTLRVQ